MNSKIKALNSELSKINVNIADIELQLQAEWNKVFTDITSISKAVERLHKSNECSWDKHGEIVQWARYSNLPDFEDCAEYFETYMLDNHFVTIDWENDVIQSSVGPSIVISDNGDILDQDSDKWIIKADSYRNDDNELDETKRNELIEKWMESTGYYPGVYRTDRHGNVFAVNTRQK